MTKKKNPQKKIQDLTSWWDFISLSWKYGKWIWIIGLILIGILTIFILQNNKQFNPENDVCLEHECCIDKMFDNLCRDDINYEKCMDIGNHNRHEMDFTCNKHRPQTFCEQCIDDWTPECDNRCQCDEWEKVNRDIYTDELECKPFTMTKHNFGAIESVELKYDSLCGSNCTTEEIQDCGKYSCKTINLTTCIHSKWQYKIETKQIKGKCTKAHEKNQCEKGNPSWVWDSDCGCNGARVCIIPLNASEKERKEKCCTKVCREKTIQDLNCTELTYVYKYGRDCERYSPWKQKLINCKYPDFKSKIDIVYAMVEKGCGVEG